MEGNTARLPQAGTVLENSPNPLERFRAGESDQEVLVLPRSYPPMTGQQAAWKARIPCPISSARAIFRGALLLVCEEPCPGTLHAWDEDPAQPPVLLSSGTAALGGTCLEGSLSQPWQWHPANRAYTIFQLKSAALHTW